MSTALLERAATELTRGDAPAALLTLLDAWRERRHTRIANAIDLVSDLVKTSRPAIVGKTAAAKRAAWTELASKKDPCDIGRLLEVPWPGKWQEAEPVADAWMVWPDDPRIAMAFAKVCVEGAYDSYKTYNFYNPVVHAIGRWNDRRALPLLEKNDGGHRSYYKRDTMGAQASAVEALRAFEEPALDARDEAALAAIEARFDSTTTLGKTERELYDEILAHPDDLGVRSVWADALVRLGDERGELVSLLLAAAEGRSTPKSARRLGALKKKLRRTFAGDLDEVFLDEPRIDDGGLFAGGVVHGPTVVEKLHARAAGHVLRALDLTNVPDAEIDLTKLATVRALHVVSGRELARLAEAGPWAIEALTFSTNPSSEARQMVARSDAFPRVTLLGAPPSAAAWLVGSPLFARATTLASSKPVELARWMASVQHVASFAGRLVSRPSWISDKGLHIEVKRFGSGFEVEIAWTPDTSQVVEELATFFGALPPGSLVRLRIANEEIGDTDGGAARVLRSLARHASSLEAADIGFARAETIETLAGRARGGAPKFDGGSGGELVRIDAKCDERLTFEERAVAMFDASHALDMGLDSVSSFGRVESYGELAAARDPRALVEKRAREAEHSTTTITREDATNIFLYLSRYRAEGMWCAPLPSDPARLVAWILELAPRIGILSAAIRMSSGDMAAMSDSISSSTNPITGAFSRDIPSVGNWCGFIGSRVTAHADDDDEKALRALGVSVDRGAGGWALRFAATPTTSRDTTRAPAIADALRALAFRCFARRWGFDLETLARAELAPLLRARGMPDELTTHRPGERGLRANMYASDRGPTDVDYPFELRFVRTFADERVPQRGLVLELHDAFGAPTLAGTWVFKSKPDRFFADGRDLGRWSIAGLDKARESFAAIARVAGDEYPNVPGLQPG